MTYPTGADLVTVVVASYNHENFLVERMDSLIGQTYPNLEILVIDDKSTDNSRSILRRYAKSEGVSLIERSENGGWVEVSNQGVSLAKGEYILFANCDDTCSPELISRLVQSIQQNDSIGVSFCRSEMIDENGKTIGNDFDIRSRSFREYCQTDKVIDRDMMRKFLMHSCVIPNLSAALIRKKCLEEVGTFSAAYKACSDWDLFFRIADRFDFSYIAFPLNKFRQHGTTIRSATKGRITYDEFFRVLLGQINHPEFSILDRGQYRLHIMYLWAIELLRPSMSGWKNFWHHSKLIAKLDTTSLLFLLPAMTKRIVELPMKAAKKMR